jgi:uncharacterized protein YrrD
VEPLGPPIAWVALEEGTPVYDPHQERIGVVERVLADQDIFEGLIVHTRPLPGHHLAVDADQISELHERGVLLSVERDALREPPKKTQDRGAADRGLQARLRHAWDWIMRRN